ncbi:hypothetical protein GCM10009555_008500 [Acrocarpospora macrocephala]|uniref:Uncharacterized protein n=1 Tax=Acrocarpospora macrocephala TaxID=150177 RepID=A0A5M3WZD9_9ACTN|nr:hypothetical protein [Acrocarpospora macrocephala]GES14867.1 hypothetical protein Amac_084640 [Acrocarpospora macrocephala]
MPVDALPEHRAPFLRANAVTLVAGTTGLALAAIVWLRLPHEHTIESLWIFLFKLLPFVAMSVAIAWLDPAWARWLRLPMILIPCCFLIFYAVFIPRMFFVAGEPGSEYYYTVLTLVPFIILSIALAYRLGGGSRSGTLRLCGAMIILQLSGLEDLAFLVINPHTDPAWTPIPEVWHWAEHIRVRLGHYPAKHEAYIFIAVHVALAIAVLAVPGRAVLSLTRRLRRSP